MRIRLGVALVAAVCAFGGLLATARPAASAALPSLTVGDVKVWEGNGGALVAKVPVDLSVVPSSDVTVSYTVSSDASPDSASTGDFLARTGKFVFRAGYAPSKSVLVKVYGDTNPEPDEHVLVHVTSVVGAQLEKPDGGVTILNDDGGSGGSGVTVGIGSVSVVEADGGRHIASLPVTLSVPPPTTIKVAYSVDCGTAVAGTDYTSRSSGTVTFLQGGAQTRYINFQIAADTVPEAFVKQVIDNISVTVGPAVVREAQGDATIVDNDVTAPTSSGPVPVGAIQRVSVSSTGEEAQPPPENLCDTAGVTAPKGIWGSAISRDGRYVAFASSAGNLVPGDTNGLMDVFVRDLQTQATERVSLKPDGTQFTSSQLWASGSQYPAISADGRYVSFYNGGTSRLYLWDRATGTTQQISSASGGGSGEASISDDGRYVVYASSSSQIPGVTIPPQQDAVYLWDRDTGTTTLVTIRSTQTVDGFTYSWGKPVISGNGRFVAFTDGSSDLVPNDANNCADDFVRDLQTGQTERVSVTTSGAEQATQWDVACSYGPPTISDDGRFVGFSSAAWNLYPGATGSTDLGSGAPNMHAYLHDRLASTTELVDINNPMNSEGTFNAVSDDGRYAIFACFCGDPVPTVPTKGDFVSMWLDRQTGALREVGVQSDGTPPIDEDNGWFTFTVAWGGVSGDGKTVAFQSNATNLVPDDANGMQDAFVQQMG